MQILIVDSESHIHLALNSAVENCDVIALNFELAAVGDAPPPEMMLIPPGLRVEGRDGRAWNNPNPQGIVDFFAERGLDIPIDIEHATELKGPKGEPAPAAAWCRSLSARPDGSVWAKIEWTPPGTELIINRQYRYYSPAIVFDRQTMNIVGIKSVGLTNTPNFTVPALNSEHNKKESNMNLVALLAALGLASTATFDEALNSISKMRGDLDTALNHAKAPPLDKFVPKADYDLALNRANDAEGKLKAHEKATLETAINTEIDAALKAGKITPATKEYHVAQCRQEGGLDRFKAFCQAAPSVAADTKLDTKKVDGQDTALNAEEKAVCIAMGISEEEYLKANPA